MEARLAELERRLARAELRAAITSCLGLLILVGSLILAARPAETRGAGDIVRAPFRVVDGAGKTLMVLDTGEWNNHWDAPGGPRLRLFDRVGRPTATLMAADDGGALSLDRNTGKRSLGLFAGGGGAALTFENPRDEGIPSAVLQAHQDGSALTLYSGEGHPAVEVDATRGGGKLELRRGENRLFTAP